MEQKNNQTLTDEKIDSMIQKMNLVYFAIIAGVVGFAALSFYLVEIAGKNLSPELDDTFKIVVPLLAVSCAFASRFLYSRLIKKAALAEGSQRIANYQAAILVRLAILEGPCLFAIVAYLLIGNSFYLIILAAILILMLLHKPSRFRYQEEMEAT